MEEDSPRQGRPHTVVVTVRIRYALNAHDALAAALAGAGELIDVVVMGDGGDPGKEEHASTALAGRLH